RGSETHSANHQQNHRPGLSQIEIAAARLMEQQEDPDGHDDGRSHQPADGAAQAGATDAIAISHFSSYSSKFRAQERRSNRLRNIKTPTAIKTSGHMRRKRQKGNQSKLLSKSSPPMAIRMIGPIGRFLLQDSSGSTVMVPARRACAVRMASKA